MRILCRKISRAGFTAGSLGTLSAIPVAVRAQSPRFSWKWATDEGPGDSIPVRAVQAFAKIRKDTDGGLEIKAFTNNSLGSNSSIIQQIRLGALEMLSTGGSAIESLAPTAGVENVAFAFTTRQAACAATEGDLGAIIRAQALKINLLLFEKMFETGYRQFTARLGPIRTVDDLQGLKLRVPPGKIRTDTFNSLGCAAVTVEPNELYTALQTHVCDAMESSLPTLESYRIFEVQKYCSITNHMWSGHWTYVNLSKWNSAPARVPAKPAYADERGGGVATARLRAYGSFAPRRPPPSRNDRQRHQARQFPRETHCQRLLPALPGTVRRTSLDRARKIRGEPRLGELQRRGLDAKAGESRELQRRGRSTQRPENPGNFNVDATCHEGVTFPQAKPCGRTRAGAKRMVTNLGWTKPFRTGPDGAFEVAARGFQVLHTPQINKGTAFSAEERETLGLVGLLPPAIMTIEQQADRTYDLFRKQPDALAKNTFLTALKDRNETLFYYLVGKHVEEMFPIVYTPTVGTAIQLYSQQFRRPSGVFLQIDRPERIEQSLANAGAGPEDIDLLVATDAESILGIGDWGVGGIDICVGKLTVYTASAGIDPCRAVPVMLDVGTDNQSLLDNPLYLGYRHPRVRGEQYREFIDAYVTAAQRMFPRALLHWEDFGAVNARWILSAYRDRACTFNDDLQGTAGIVLASALAGVAAGSGRIRDQRILVFGAGTAGCGIADLLHGAMVADGLTADEASGRFWCVDRDGLLVDGMQLREFQVPYARSRPEVAGWNALANGAILLEEVVRRVGPTILIGTSGVAGAFNREVIEAMAKATPHPIVLPLSIPTVLAEAVPADVIAWSDGRALVAPGSPFAPVVHGGVTHRIGQANNALLFPGLGLAAIVMRAKRISDGMFSAAAHAIAGLVDTRAPGAALLPPVESLREVSRIVAIAVAEQARSEGLAQVDPPDIAAAIRAGMWEPRYRTLRAV